MSRTQLAKTKAQLEECRCRIIQFHLSAPSLPQSQMRRPIKKQKSYSSLTIVFAAARAARWHLLTGPLLCQDWLRLIDLIFRRLLFPCEENVLDHFSFLIQTLFAQPVSGKKLHALRHQKVEPREAFFHLVLFFHQTQSGREDDWRNWSALLLESAASAHSCACTSCGTTITHTSIIVSEFNYFQRAGCARPRVNLHRRCARELIFN